MYVAVSADGSATDCDATAARGCVAGTKAAVGAAPKQSGIQVLGDLS